MQDSLGLRDADELAYFVRFASDEQGRNYYELRSPLPVNLTPRGVAWKEEQLELTEMSNLKLEPGFQDSLDLTGFYRSARPSNAADTVIIKGRPSFTRLRRISMGLVNRSSYNFV